MGLVVFFPVEFNQSDEDFKTPEVFPILCALLYVSDVKPTDKRDNCSVSDFEHSP